MLLGVVWTVLMCFSLLVACVNFKRGQRSPNWTALVVYLGAQRASGAITVRLPKLARRGEVVHDLKGSNVADWIGHRWWFCSASGV